VNNLTPIAFSSPVFASASLPALDCVNLMRDRESRAILITDGISSDQAVVGIFTESDLIRNFARLRMAENRFLPIREVMSSPVLTLPVADFTDARKLMVTKSIRTVPLVKGVGSLTASKIAGVVHAFDIVKSGMGLHSSEPLGNLMAVRAVIVSQNPWFASYLENCFAFFRSVELISLRDLNLELMESKVAAAENVDGNTHWIIIDADHFSEETLTECLAFVQYRRNPQSLVFLFDEFLSGGRVEKILQIFPKEVWPILVKKPVCPSEWVQLVSAVEEARR
jgi:CBS domain-containing protein